MKQYVLPNDKQIVTMLSSISKPHTIIKPTTMEVNLSIINSITI